MEEFRSKYPEWCVTHDAPATASGAKAADGRPHLRMPAASPARQPLNGPAGRRPGSLGSRSASDSEEERPDSSLESADQHAYDEDNGPRAFGSGFSLGLSVGLRLGLESEPLPNAGHSSSSSTSSSASSFNGSSSSSATMTSVQSTEGPVDPLADPGFPVEILPHLFLGNAQNSRDCDALNKHHIRVRPGRTVEPFDDGTNSFRSFVRFFSPVRGERDAQLAERLRGQRRHQVPTDPDHGPLEPEFGQLLPVGHQLHR